MTLTRESLLDSVVDDHRTGLSPTRFMYSRSHGEEDLKAQPWKKVRDDDDAERTPGEYQIRNKNICAIWSINADICNDADPH